MVDLAIASNFARELTEEQFDSRRSSRSRPRGADRYSARQPAGRRGVSAHHEAAVSRNAQVEVRASGTVLGRVLSRLVHVRG